MGQGGAGFAGLLEEGIGKALEPGERALRGMEPVKGEVELLAVAARDQGVTDGHRAETLFPKVLEGVEVAQAFRHLLALDHEVRAVEPVAAEVSPVSAFGLGDFVFVVGEAEVDPAAVQVDRLACEDALNHRGTLQMPTGAPFAPGAGPVVRAVFGLARLPQDKVSDGCAVVFVGIVERACGVFALGAEFALLEAGETAVVIEGTDAEVNRAVSGGIGVAFLDEFLNQLDLLRNVFDRAGLSSRGQHV